MNKPLTAPLSAGVMGGQGKVLPGGFWQNRKAL